MIADTQPSPKAENEQPLETKVSTPRDLTVAETARVKRVGKAVEKFVDRIGN